MSTAFRPLASPVHPASAPALDLAALVGAAGWARLPASVRRRFGVDHGAVTYIGRMELRCSPVGRVHALLSRLFGSPLTSANAHAVPASVRVFDDGRGGMVWERSFHTAGAAAPHVVRSIKQRGADGGLQERTAGGLGMALRAFECDGALVFESHAFALFLGRVRIPVPALFTPGTCRVTHADLGDGLFRFELDMRHPLWGHTFHQAGVFVDPAHVEGGAA
ncbi:MAG: DUF4166 domain-containing protein [Betaproteobacteria bacterium]